MGSDPRAIENISLMLPSSLQNLCDWRLSAAVIYYNKCQW